MYLAQMNYIKILLLGRLQQRRHYQIKLNIYIFVLVALANIGSNITL